MKYGGSMDLGQASEQLNIVWHLQTPSSHPTIFRRSVWAMSLVSATNRAAFTDAAGPMYFGSVQADGQADRQAPQSMQSIATSIFRRSLGDCRYSLVGYGSRENM